MPKRIRDLNQSSKKGQKPEWASIFLHSAIRTLLLFASPIVQNDYQNIDHEKENMGSLLFGSKWQKIFLFEHQEKEIAIEIN